MQKKRPVKRNEHLELIVEDHAFGGKGISRIQTAEGDYVVFIPLGIPGQKVLVRIAKARSQYAEARLLKVLERSELEEHSPYHETPGAPYLNLALSTQKKFKEEATLALFSRIGKIADAEKSYDRWIASPRSHHYRNKMEYSFSAVKYLPETDRFVDEFALGFKKRGQWLAVQDLPGDSGLFDVQMEALMPEIADYFKSRNLTAWHSRRHEGFCRMLAVRKSFNEDLLLINFLSSSQQLDAFDPIDFKDFLLNHLGERLGGLIHTVDDDISDRPKSHAGEKTLLYGRPTLEEKILGLRFEISLESFFQTNPASAEKLYAQALEYVREEKPAPGQFILDLFCGTGTITQLLAQGAPDHQIVGVELVAEAIADARKSAQANQLKNIEFHQADVGRFLNEYPQYRNRVHTVSLDPPRAGISPKTLQKIIDLDASRLVYVSCNPATQARDFIALRDAGYVLRKFSLVDQFPHTAHVESVALLGRH